MIINVWILRIEQANCRNILTFRSALPDFPTTSGIAYRGAEAEAEKEKGTSPIADFRSDSIPCPASVSKRTIGENRELKWIGRSSLMYARALDDFIDTISKSMW